MLDTVRIIHWNAEGLSKQKISLLRALVAEQNIDLVLLSETHLRSTDSLKFPNYYVYRQDELSDAGRAFRGLAVLVKRRIVHQPIPQMQLQSFYALGVELSTNETPIRVFAAYKPPGDRLDVRDVHNLMDSQHPTVIAGDMNVKHTAWNSRLICPNGRRLLDDSERMRYEVLAPEVPTHYPHNSAYAPDVIDIALSKGIPSPLMTTDVLDEHMISDHQPVLLTIARNHIVRPPPRSRTLYDWEAFESYVHQHVTTRPVNTTADVDLLATEFCAQTQSALKHATREAPKRAIHSQIPAFIKKMITEKRRLRKTWQRTRCPTMKTQLNQMAVKISEALQTSATETWQSHIESASDDWSSIHRLCRQISNRPQPVRPLLANDGTPRYRSVDRAEIFADHLERQFRPNPVNDTAHEAEVNNHLVEYFAQPIANDEDPIVFSPGQVDRMIRRTKLRKAPGPDGIPNEALRRLPPRAIATATRLFNGILRTGHFPSEWKLGRVIMIPKPGKNILKPESYRPITLLPTISKVFEKLLLSHLVPHITPRDEQFGFRAEHSTTLQLSRVLHHMTTAFNKKEHTVAVLLDMEKAFDRVWHPGLLYKLSTSTTPRRIVKTVATFLADRRFQVAVEDALSQERKIEAGVPQGSCLSPVCYAKYTDDIPLEEGAHLALYADDAAYYSSSIRNYFAVTKIQRTLDILPAWLEKWRLTVNVAKTQAICVGRGHPPKTKIRLLAQEVEWSPVVKYLGVSIDRRLSMKAHVKNVIATTRVARNLLKPVLRANLPLRVKIGVYKTYIRPRLTYAAPAWYALTSTPLRNRLASQQSLSLRTIVNAPRFVRNATIQRDLRFEKLEEFIRRLSKMMFKRVDESSLPHIHGMAPHHARPPDMKQMPRDLVEEDSTDEEA